MSRRLSDSPGTNWVALAQTHQLSQPALFSELISSLGQVFTELTPGYSLSWSLKNTHLG